MSELMDVILACENDLGWSGPANLTLWKGRASGFARLEAAIARTDPTPTIADLYLAIAWARRRRQAIASPVELIGMIADAKRVAAEPENPSILEIQVRSAIAWERERADGLSTKWESRLTRAVGPVRAEVLTEWRETRGE